ncbi:MAG: hypothetical protein ABJO36_01595 [Litorimonas sp.]
MKRLSKQLIQPLLLVLPMTFLFAGPVCANQITTIDFRDGITEEKLARYHQAVFGGSNSEFSPKLIKLLVSADKGFDAGWLQVPKTRRVLRVNVVIYTFRGESINAPIKVNLYELDGQTIKYVNLETTLR